MPTTAEKRTVAPSRVAPSSANLCEAIEQTIDRRATDTVRCTRVYGDKYRVNWWVGVDCGVASRIRQSRFLQVNLVDGALKIEDLTA